MNYKQFLLTKQKIRFQVLLQILSFFVERHIIKCIAQLQILLGIIKNMHQNLSSGLISLDQELGNLIWKRILLNPTILIIKRKGLFINGKTMKTILMWQQIISFQIVKSMEKKHDLPLIQDVETINFNVVYMQENLSKFKRKQLIS